MIEQAITTNMSKLRVKGMLKIITYNQNSKDLATWWFGKPCLLNFANT